MRTFDSTRTLRRGSVQIATPLVDVRLPRRPADGDAYEKSTPARRPAADEAPAVHELIGKYDAPGLRAHLEKNPEAIRTRDASGDPPLHAVASKGAVILAELLDELGVNHLASDRRGLFAGHRAAEKHPRTAAFLFDRAIAARGSEATKMSPKAVAEKIAEHGLDTEQKIDTLAAALCGLKRAGLNAPQQVVKNRTHLEAVKGTILEQKSEGWWQADFGPQRVRSLMTAIADIDEHGAPVPNAKAQLVAEVSTQLDLLRTIRRVRETSKCSSASIRRSAMNLEASLVTPRILSADREVALALGWKGHAIYGGFVKVPASTDHPESTLLVRIDNRGSGATLAHDKDDDGAVISRAFHVPLTYLESDEGKKAFEAFVANILLVKATPDSNGDAFYAHVADFKRTLKESCDPRIVESSHGVPPEAALPAQIAGNCVVANTFPGLSSRLGPELYSWFTDFERGLARELVDEFADPNAMIDEECRERDEREIGKLLDNDGPWAEQLRTILDAAKYPGAKRLGAKVTAKQLGAIIEAGDHEALKLLLAHGAPIEEQGDRDRTPLHVAARAGQEACVAALLEAEANVHAMDEDGNTPLHLAILASSSPSVSALLRSEADRDRENRAGVTPRAMIAEQMDQTMLIAKSLDTAPDRPAVRGRRRPFAPTGT